MTIYELYQKSPSVIFSTGVQNVIPPNISLRAIDTYVKNTYKKMEIVDTISDDIQNMSGDDIHLYMSSYLTAVYRMYEYEINIMYERLKMATDVDKYVNKSFTQKHTITHSGNDKYTTQDTTEIQYGSGESKTGTDTHNDKHTGNDTSTDNRDETTTPNLTNTHNRSNYNSPNLNAVESDVQSGTNKFIANNGSSVTYNNQHNINMTYDTNIKKNGSDKNIQNATNNTEYGHIITDTIEQTGIDNIDTLLHDDLLNNSLYMKIIQIFLDNVCVQIW